jgi:thioredoxin 1
MLTIKKDNFDLLLKNNDKPILVDFWAEWCGPCKALMPIIEELATELTDVDIGKCNVDDEAILAERFNIQTIPTLLLFKDGELLDKRIGGSSKASLKEWINQKIGSSK